MENRYLALEHPAASKAQGSLPECARSSHCCDYRSKGSWKTSSDVEYNHIADRLEWPGTNASIGKPENHTSVAVMKSFSLRGTEVERSALVTGVHERGDGRVNTFKVLVQTTEEGIIAIQECGAIVTAGRGQHLFGERRNVLIAIQIVTVSSLLKGLPPPH